MTHPPSPPHRMLLPEISPDVVGGRLVSRAVSITLVIFVLLFGGAALAATLIKLKVTVDGSGVLQPSEIWAVRSEETGVVRDVLVRMGDTVRSGQPIAHLDTLKLASDLDQLRSRRRALELGLQLQQTSVPLEVRTVQEQRSKAEAELVRARAALRQRLVEHGFDPDIDTVRRTYQVGTNVAIDEGLGNLLVAEGAARTARIEAERLGLKSIEQSRQQEQMQEIDFQIATAQQRLARLTLNAPATGIVLTDGLERLPGKVVQEGESLLEIAEEEEGWRAELLVAERDVSRVSVGDEVQVELRAFGRVDSPKLRGTVQTVGAEPAVATTSPTRMFPVVVRMHREDLEAVGLERLRRGYTAEAKIVTRSERMIRLIWEYLLRRTERKKLSPQRTDPAPPAAESKA
jgi:multidrug resistance efflux pump